MSECGEWVRYWDLEGAVVRGYDVKKLTFDPGPLAFIIRLFNTSAGEHTVVATVPYNLAHKHQQQKLKS